MKIHFISIGGSVMHQLAIALKRKGYQITGSDDEIFEPARTNLEHEGLLPAKIGWDEARVHVDYNAIILGMHARADNPELLRAKELNLPIYSFPGYIFKESEDKKRIVVGGSHGKTTTTAIIMHVLKEAGQNFDYLVGARLAGFNQSVRITNAPLIVCEGDEYPASAIEPQPKFHFLYPHIAVLTGIAWDHINIFPTFENYLEQFRIFINKIESGGVLIYNETDAVVADMIQRHNRTDVRYLGYGVPAHFIANGETSVVIEGAKEKLQVFGTHNLLNLHAAWLVCRQLGINSLTFTKAASTFKGASKRLELLGKNDSTVVYRDFAHAPSKVAATMDAARAQFPGKKLIAIFELHTYSSLNEAFMKEYKGVMDGADEGAVFYSSHALKIKSLAALPKEAVALGFATQGLSVINSKKELEDWLHAKNFTNSLVLFMSSGNYEGLNIEEFAKKITGKAI